MTKNERADAFMKELLELMRKHDVSEIRAEDHFVGYAECGEDVRMTISMDSEYKDFELVKPYVEIDVGSTLYAKGTYYDVS